MTAPQPELEEAARTLLQWARARQTTWRDPSAELLAALGNRYQALEESAPASVPDAPRTAWAPAQPEAPVPIAVVAPTPAASSPLAPAAFTEPNAHGSAGVRVPVAPSIAREAPPHEPLTPARPSSRWMPWVAAAGLILAAIAVPRMWRSYAPAEVAAPTVGILSLDSTPAGSAVLIDGVDAGTTPLQKEIGTGAHQVEFRYKKSSRTLDLTVVGGETTAGVVDWSRKPVGQLKVTSDIANTKVLVDGKARGNAPLSLDNLSVGSHVVTFRSAQGSVKQRVVIKEGATAELAASIYPGSLHVSAPFEVEITERGRLLRFDDKNQAVLTPGPHTLRVLAASHGLNEERTVEILPGKLTPLEISAPAVPVPAPAEGTAVPDAPPPAPFSPPDAGPAATEPAPAPEAPGDTALAEPL